MATRTPLNSRCFCLTLFALLLAPVLALTAEQTRPRRVIYNSDADNLFIYVVPPMKPADVHKYVDEIAATGVTTLAICPNYGMVMNYPSKITEMVGTGVSEAEDRRIEKVAREQTCTIERAIVNLRGLIKTGADPLGLIIERARAKKLEVFLTFRLNECHSVDKPDEYPGNLIISRAWKAHPEWRIGKVGAKLPALHKEILGPDTNPIVGDWLPGGFNFALPEVRKLRLAELRECCERYPVDGLDLDFQRFPMYFPPGEESAHIATMTAWVREIRAMTREIGRKRGRPILLSARIMARPEQNLGLGLDPVNWSKEGLLDFVTVSHYLRNDFALPIQKYRALLPPALPIYGSIEVAPDAATYRRIAGQLWKDSVDGILFFNYFTTRENNKEPDFALLRELAAARK